jgi:hypothetical protein
VKPERLAEIKARTNEAKPGPWRLGWKSPHYPNRIKGPDNKTIMSAVCNDPICTPHEATARFIAAARQDVPDLLAEVERLRAEVVVWHEYDQAIKAALGGWRYQAPTVPESVAAVVEKASRYDDLCE